MRLCRECQDPMTLKEACQTLVGYFSPPGHDHDANCTTLTYRCPQGHQETLRIQKGCLADGCDWKGPNYCTVCNAANVWDVDALHELAAKQAEWKARRKSRGSGVSFGVF